MRIVTLLQPKKVVFGQGCATQCAEDVLAEGFKRALIVTSPPIIGLAGPLADALKAGGAAVMVYAEIATEPSVSMFETAPFILTSISLKMSCICLSLLRGITF